MTILAARSLSLPGALNGVAFYFGLVDRGRSQLWRLIEDTSIWTDAATQVIFSLGPACGGVITLASYNKFDRNCHRDAVVIALANAATSVFCGVVVFAALGFMAEELSTPIEDVVEGGPGLAFVAYPVVVSRMGVSAVWAVLFFAMLICLALGSIFGAFEGVISAASDAFPDALRTRKTRLVLGMTTGMFLLGLPFTCGGGIHMFTLFNASAPSSNLLVFVLLEVAVVGWIYGAEKCVYGDLPQMNIRMGKFAAFYWISCWKFITPTILIILLILSFFNMGQVGYGAYTYPWAVQALGCLITVSTVAWIPIVGVVRICGGLKPDAASLLHHTQDWGRKNAT